MLLSALSELVIVFSLFHFGTVFKICFLEVLALQRGAAKKFLFSLKSVIHDIGVCGEHQIHAEFIIVKTKAWLLIEPLLFATRFIALKQLPTSRPVRASCFSPSSWESVYVSRVRDRDHFMLTESNWKTEPMKVVTWHVTSFASRRLLHFV